MLNKPRLLAGGMETPTHRLTVGKDGKNENYGFEKGLGLNAQGFLRSLFF